MEFVFLQEFCIQVTKDGQILLPANPERTELNENASGTLKLNDYITTVLFSVYVSTFENMN